MQSKNAEVQVHLRNATIKISNDDGSEPMTTPTKDKWMDPKSLDTTTMGLGHTLPENHTDDNGLLERNLYSSDTKNERISISPSTSLSQDSVSDSNFPETKSLKSPSKLPPKMLKYSNEPQFFKRGLHDFIQVVTPIFITRLPGVSSKTRPTGHRRGRPPPTDSKHS